MRITRTNASIKLRTAAVSARFHLSGFTLLELTAVIAIITVLVSLLCAALNQTKEKALRISCMENVKQLQFAWQMYTDDADGNLPLNQTAESSSPHHRIPQKGSSTNSWVVGDPVTDPRTANIERGSLFQYVKSVGPYRCQLDDSRVVGHPQVLRTRSYSMNAFLGGDGVLNPAMKYVELSRPGNTFVFIEEHEQSLWGSSFVVLPELRPSKLTAAGAPVQSWVSTPSDRHAQGCSLSFADSHVEYWRWYSPKTIRDSKLSSAATKNRELRDLNRLQAVVGQ